MKLYQLVPVAYLQRLIAIQQKYEPDAGDLPDKSLIEKKEVPKTPIFYDEEQTAASTSKSTLNTSCSFVA